MVAYKYRGYDSDGNKVAGELTASTVEEVERRLAGQEITLVALVPVERAGGSGRSSQPSARRRRTSEADAADVLESLAVMAETGVPIVEAVEAVAASTRNRAVAEQLQQIKLDIMAGASMSASLRNAPLFPGIVADMVKIAEEGGRLDRALRAAASYLQRSADLRKRVVNAMIYPAVMVAISILTLLVLLLFVLPRFGQMFGRLGSDLPITTKLMLDASAAVRGQPVMSLAVVVGALVGLRAAAGLPATRARIGPLLLRLPMVGELLRKLAYARSFQSISTLISSNVPLITALEHGSKVAGVGRISKALLSARAAVEHGQALAPALRETGAFPPTLIQMVTVGERTGRLGQLLQSWAHSTENEVDARLKALVAVVEPAMIVVMGAIIGTITVSIISPIYSVVEKIR